MRIGCHVSIAGGIFNAPKNAADLGCEVFQMFSRPPQGGSAPQITDEVVKQFKDEMKKWEQGDCYIHTPYYINFASANKSTRDASARVVREELNRGSLIGAKYVMTHLGSAKDLGREEGIKITAEGIAKVLKNYKGTTGLLLEISAGAGNIIGDTFDEIYKIIKLSGNKANVCLDSAHMFASGYDIKTQDEFKVVAKSIKDTFGLNRVKLIHANDSKVGLGERKDRHDHIGDGKIGKEGFVNLMSIFKKVDFILETKHDKVKEDIRVLKRLRSA